MNLELKHITKKFADAGPNEAPVVSDVNLTIGHGSLCALLGPSGSGKTTLLRIIAGLESPTSGEILMDGTCVNSLTPYERKIGFVFQNYALFRYMNVYDNIAFGLSVQKESKAVIKDRVDELLELTELKDFKKRYPNQLSGGQRQRVAFARALAPNPSLLLLDEPFAAIDAKVRKELRSWLREMIYQIGITSIFVTHDQDEAIEVADRIIVLNHGIIEQTGSPMEIYKTPDTPFVSEFIGQGTIIKDYYKLHGFEQGNYKGAVIRPEFVEAFKDDNAHFSKMLGLSEKGVIKDILFRGNSLEVRLDVNGVELTTFRSLERRPIRIGEQMNVIVYRLYAFDDHKVYLLENSDLPKLDTDNTHLTSYLYSSDGFFVS